MPHSDPSIEEFFRDDDRFDDSVREQHQRELRSEVLEAFDQAQQDASVVRLPAVDGAERKYDVKTIFGYVVVLACLILGFLTYWTFRLEDLPPPSPRQPIVSTVSVDARLLESLVAVEAYRDHVPREALFEAIAMCQQDYEGLLRDESAP